MNRKEALGWTAVALSTLVASFWAWWGITENFHEGWYYTSFFQNVGWMLVRYMSPMIVFLFLGTFSIGWPQIGGGLHILAGIMIPLLFSRNLTATLIMVIPLLILGVLYYRSSSPPAFQALIVLFVVPVLLAMVLAIEPVVRIIGRIDDGYNGARVIQGNGVRLVWAPRGPGWPTWATNWEEAKHMCLYLRADGITVSDTPQNIWRLPTVKEAVQSMERHMTNCKGVWDSAAGKAYYDATPDKESPLWEIHSPVVYWWTSTEIDSKYVYKIATNGMVSRMNKITRERDLSYRAVRELMATDTIAPPMRPDGMDTVAGRGNLVHTFSIVARDTVTGELGVAVQSHWFSVGSTVTWAEAGVGAVATQSFIDPSYGPLGLDLMRAGKTARQALDALLASDPGKDVRQVAMVDVHGIVATHTGSKCIESAGHFTGRNYSVQANLMLNDKVWPAMSRTFETSRGDLADRMLAALDAGQSVGGDIRGKQSAALLIVKGQSTGRPWADKLVDLRVEDNPEPLKELRRLVAVQRAYTHMNNGDLAVEHNDVDGALREYGSAEAMFPDNLEMKFWHAVALVNVGRVDQSLPMFKEIFAKDANWATLLPRLPASGTLLADKATIDKILAVAPKK
jgi:uncharacterized Ntn-hydrolase superfamily protein